MDFIKQLNPDGMTIEELKIFRDGLPQPLTDLVKGSVKVVQVIEQMRYGVIDEQEGQRKINEIWGMLRKQSL